MRCERCGGLVVAEHFSAGATSIGGRASMVNGGVSIAVRAVYPG